VADYVPTQGFTADRDILLYSPPNTPLPQTPTLPAVCSLQPRRYRSRYCDDDDLGGNWSDIVEVMAQA